MITDAILNLFYSFCQFVIGILPDEYFMTPDPDSNLWQISRAIEYICPRFFEHTLEFLGYVIIVFTVVFIYKIIKLIRG